MLDYQNGEEVIYAGGKAKIEKVHGDGWITIKVDGKFKSVFYDELKRQEFIKVEYLGRSEWMPPGTISNAIIQRRNGGVRPQFIDSIGGDSSNYR